MCMICEDWTNLFEKALQRKLINDICIKAVKMDFIQQNMIEFMEKVKKL